MRNLIIIIAAMLATPTMAQDRTFGGHDCSVDCEGHAAGYEWARKKDVRSFLDCRGGNSLSFREGCEVYTRDRFRGSEETDQGESIYLPPSKRRSLFRD